MKIEGFIIKSLINKILALFLSLVLLLSSGLNIVSFAESESGVDDTKRDVRVFLNEAFFTITVHGKGLIINNIEPLTKTIKIPESIFNLKVLGVNNCKNYGLDKITFEGYIYIIDNCEFEAQEIEFNSVNQIKDCKIIGEEEVIFRGEIVTFKDCEITAQLIEFENKINKMGNCTIDVEEMVFREEMGTINDCEIEVQLIEFKNKVNKIEKGKINAGVIKFEDELKEIEDCNLKNTMLFAVLKNETESFIEKFLSVLPENYNFEFLDCDDEFNCYVLKENLDEETKKEYDAFSVFEEPD